MSLQVSGALVFFYLATITSVFVMKSVGSKKITWIALALAVGACILLSKAPKVGEADSDYSLDLG